MITVERAEPLAEPFNRRLPATSEVNLNGYASLVQSHLDAMYEDILDRVREFDASVVPLLESAVENHGKGLRPTLAFLSGQATGGITGDHSRLALVVEMLHLATLVHDDILDGASERRGKPTAVVSWGADVAVLMGDCLFAAALRECTYLPQEFNREISSAVCEVCSGEIIQSQRRHDWSLSLEDYLRIIAMKTGALFRIPCQLAAQLNQAPPALAQALCGYGERLGVAYQIYDDCVDLGGDATRLGKTLGTDLQRGKLTLPVLLWLRKASDAAQRAQREALLNHGELTDRFELLTLIRESGALAEAIAVVTEQLDLAVASLRVLPESAARSSLESLPVTLRQQVLEVL